MYASSNLALEYAISNFMYRRRSNYASFLILRQNSMSQTDNYASYSSSGDYLRNAITTAAWLLARSAHSTVER